MTPPDLHGIHAILYAFFDGEERLDREAMRRQVALCHAAGAHGIAALGLATEVAKLTEAERRTVMDWTAEDNGGRLPLGLTISGSSVAEQVAGTRHAEGVKADWVILQPPMAGSFAAAEYIRFFGRVADATTLPVAIQNAPAYLGRGLSAEDIASLCRQHPNVCLLKGEGSAVEIERLIAATEGRVPVFNGRGGLELVESLEAGCAGLVLAPDTIDHTVSVYNRFRAGDIAGARAAYREVSAAIIFIMQSIEHFICYGKRIFAARAGLAVHDRAPALRPTPFGLARAAEHAAALGAIEHRRHIEEIEAGLDSGSDEKRPIGLRSVLVASGGADEAADKQSK
jgi:4-hydroxy-tetrahydrodipicolinate synthase